MKKMLFMAVAFFAFSAANAQDEGKIRASFDLGLVVPGSGFGGLSNLELNYNLSDDKRVGLRIGSALFVRDLELDDNDDFASGDFSTNLNFLGTLDYCFNSGSSFVPYVGGGIGFYNVAGYAGRSGEDYEFSVLEFDFKFGALLRGGFEAGKFRFGLEYNFIPSGPLLNAEGMQLGDISHGYFGISLGFFLGGGWWGR